MKTSLSMELVYACQKQNDDLKAEVCDDGTIRVLELLRYHLQHPNDAGDIEWQRLTTDIVAVRKFLVGAGFKESQGVLTPFLHLLAHAT